MNDKPLSALIRAQLFGAPGLEGVQAQRNYQPRQHGANNSPTIYWTKITEPRHGAPQRKDLWDADAGQFNHVEQQLVEATWQFMANIPQDPANMNELTESDVLAIACAIMQSDEVIATFKAQGVGIERVTEVRNPQVTDDHDRFSAFPSFDVKFSHYRTRVITLPAVATCEANIRRV